MASESEEDRVVQGQDRKRMEERFGELGKGLNELTIRGKRYDLHQLLKMVGMDHADVRPIDAHYTDGSDFQYLGEHGAHIDEWLGDEYYNFPWAIFCPESV